MTPRIFIILSLFLFGCSAVTEATDQSRYENADGEPHNWFGINRGPSQDHYSPLDQINEDNIHELGFAWDYDTNTKRGLEASPVVVDGVMYTSGTWGAVYALDARTGKELWTFDTRKCPANGVGGPAATSSTGGLPFVMARSMWHH